MIINAVPDPTPRDVTRFALAVDRRGPEECWPWTRYACSRGYGQFGMTRDGKTRNYYAHRVAYAIAYGAPVAGAIVMHRCDNPSCVNPAHLSVGTSADNTADMIAKGRCRSPRGSDHPSAKLAEDDVRRIIRAVECGARSHGWLAEFYGVSQPLITNIANGKAWRHVARGATP